MTEHQTPVRDLPFIQRSELDLLTRRHNAPATEIVRIAHQPRPVAIDLTTIALEAERVVSVRTHFTAVLERALRSRHAAHNRLERFEFR